MDNEYNVGMEFEDEEEDNKEGFELELGLEESYDDSESGIEGNENDEDDEELVFNDEDRDMELINKR